MYENVILKMYETEKDKINIKKGDSNHQTMEQLQKRLAGTKKNKDRFFVLKLYNGTHIFEQKRQKKASWVLANTRQIFVLKMKDANTQTNVEKCLPLCKK